ARHLGRWLDLVDRVPVAFVQPYPLPVEAENLVAIGRLQDAQERLRMEAAGNDRQFGNRPLQPVNLEELGRSEDSQTIECMVPEFTLARESLKACQKRPRVSGGIFLPQRGLQALDEVAKPDRILLAIRM